MLHNVYPITAVKSIIRSSPVYPPGEGTLPCTRNLGDHLRILPTTVSKNVVHMAALEEKFIVIPTVSFCVFLFHLRVVPKVTP